MRTQSAAGKLRAVAAGIVIVVAGLGTPATGHAVTPAKEIDPAAAQLAKDYGLTDDEAQARIDRQDDIGALAAELSVAFRAEFGGVWIDQANAGVARVGFTRTVPEDELKRLAERHGVSGHVRGEIVPFAMAHLEAAVDQLAAGLAEANRDAEHTLSLNIRSDLNRVEIGVPAGVPLTAGQQRFVDDARGRFPGATIQSARDGEPEADACVFPFCDTHLRGGLGINGNGGCTSGFIAHAGGAARWILTAGHCLVGKPDWETRTTAGVDRPIGPSWRFSFGISGDPAGFGGDMGTILVTSNTEESGPWVWASNNRTRYPISLAWPMSFPPLGSVVCKTGRTSTFQCGPVMGVKGVVFYKKSNQILINMVTAAIISCSGDSGGPIYANHIAFGIHSGSAKKDGALCGLTEYYQDIRRATQAMGVDLLLG